MSTEKQQFVHESQKERWMKYGANVALVSLSVVILAGLVIYLSQRYDKRLDTTAAGLYSLKPQTVNIIKDNTQKIKLVSLYTAKVYDPKQQRQVDSPYAPVVRDLLEVRRRLGETAPPIVIVTLDPWRDTPARLPALARTWGLDQESRVVSGEVGQVEQVLSRWQVPRSRNLRTGELIHPSIVYLVSPAGRITHLVDGGVDATLLALGESGASPGSQGR